MKRISRLKIQIVLAMMLIIGVPASAKNAMHIVINDHLGTPQMLVDENRNVVWQADYDEFGKANVIVERVEFNLRFPGQYYDKETGLHYNYYRDYDSMLGRYMQSDPIGLGGGINTYLYVDGNPLSFIDFLGLWKCAPGQNCNVTETLDDSLVCLETCMGTEYTVTSAVRGSGGTNHSEGKAADIGENTNSGICREDFEQCFKQCFPKGSYGQREYNSGDGTHYHMQTNEGKGKTYPPYFAPGTKGHTNHDV